LAQPGIEIQLLFQNGDQQVNGDGDPNLGFDGIFRIPEKDFNTQVLLDPFEEKFDLPPLPVKLGNGEGLKLEVVGEKDQGFAGIRVGILYAAQLLRIVLPAFFNASTPVWSQRSPVLLLTGLEYTRLNRVFSLARVTKKAPDRVNL
jgi:hypothetical protein